MALVPTKTESEPTINAHEFINKELKLDLTDSYKLIEDEIIGMIDKREDAVNNGSIKDVDNMQISDVLYHAPLHEECPKHHG